MIANQKRVLHRTGGNFKCLDNKSNNEQSCYQHRGKRCQKLNCTFARFFFYLTFFLRHQKLSPCGLRLPLIDYSKCTVPTSHLKYMSYGISEMEKFITCSWRQWQIIRTFLHGPVNNQRPSNYICPRDKAPITAIEALVSIIS